MKLWVTPNGDRWLCDQCQPQFAQQIKEQGWRVAFEKWEPLLRCSECRHGDVDIFD